MEALYKVQFYFAAEEVPTTKIIYTIGNNMGDAIIRAWDLYISNLSTDPFDYETISNFEEELLTNAYAIKVKDKT